MKSFFDLDNQHLLLKNEIQLIEKVKGSYFSFQKNNSDITFYKHSYNKKIDLIDRTLITHYEYPIQYVTDTIKNLEVPSNYRFSLQYITHNNLKLLCTNSQVKNKLALTHIKVLNNNRLQSVINDKESLKHWAELLNVSYLTPFFTGVLNVNQIDELLSFKNNNEIKNFILSNFGDSINDPFNYNDYYIISTNINDKICKFKLNYEESGSKKDFYNINEIILSDLLSFLKKRSIDTYESKGNTIDERYISLISDIFNDYMFHKKNDISNLDIDKPIFAKKPDFNINLKFIQNERTLKYLKEGESFIILYKILLGSLRKHRNKNGYIMSAEMNKSFNNLINTIKEKIN